MAARLGSMLGPQAIARTRVAVPLLVGAGVVAATRPFVSWQLSTVVGWDTAALVMQAFTWHLILTADAETTARLAAREDDSRRAAGAILLTAALASLLAVAFGLVLANHRAGAEAVELTVASVAAVVLAWLVVSTHFTLHYADLYYATPGEAIDFNGDEPPDYLDFAYLAFTVGMTYQVSDTNVRARAVRRAVLRHALLSYVLGTGIIATVINVVAGFIR